MPICGRCHPGDRRTQAPDAACRNDDAAPWRATTACRMPGTIITRQYKGQTLQVRVLADGFEFDGAVYNSLSAVAKAITGSHCNGFLFFRLGEQGGAQ